MTKILYVEDNADDVYVVKSRLTRAGFTVLVAVDRLAPGCRPEEY